jgi:hypothetical protein
MSIRRFNIKYLLQQGVRMIPSKIIFDYRYNKIGITPANQAYVNVYVTQYRNSPAILVYSAELYIPLENEMNMSKLTTDIFNLPSDKFATGMYFEITNAENVEIKRIEATYNSTATITDGHAVNGLSNIKLLSFKINNVGEISTTSFFLTLNNTTSSTPTHYRIWNGLVAGAWTTYSSNIVIRSSVTGLVQLGFQVKDALFESEVLTDSIFISYPTDKNLPTNGNLMYLTDMYSPANEDTNGNLMYLTDWIE